MYKAIKKIVLFIMMACSIATASASSRCVEQKASSQEAPWFKIEEHRLDNGKYFIENKNASQLTDIFLASGCACEVVKQVLNIAVTEEQNSNKYFKNLNQGADQNIAYQHVDTSRVAIIGDGIMSVILAYILYLQAGFKVSLYLSQPLPSAESCDESQLVDVTDQMFDKAIIGDEAYAHVTKWINKNKSLWGEQEFQFPNEGLVTVDSLDADIVTRSLKVNIPVYLQGLKSKLQSTEKYKKDVLFIEKQFTTKQEILGLSPNIIIDCTDSIASLVFDQEGQEAKDF